MKYIFFFFFWGGGVFSPHTKIHTKERRGKNASQCSVLNLVSGDGRAITKWHGKKKSKQEPLMCAWPRWCTHSSNKGHALQDTVNLGDNTHTHRHTHTHKHVHVQSHTLTHKSLSHSRAHINKSLSLFLVPVLRWPSVADTNVKI